MYKKVYLFGKYVFLFVVSSKPVKISEYITVVKSAKGVRPTELCCVLICPKLVKSVIQNCGLDHDGD